MAKNFEGIKNQRYGVEIECTGLTRSSAAKAVAKVLGGSPEHYGGSYDRYDVKDSKNRTWLIRIGLNGQEFKNCRKHLLSHLEGNIAWKNPEQAIAQRERLRQERIAAREQRVEPVSEIRELNENVPDEISEPTESECEGFEEDQDLDIEMAM